MPRARLVRAVLAIAATAAVLASSACQSLDSSLKDFVGETASPTAQAYPAKVSGGGTAMSAAGCQAMKDKDPQPLECVKVPQGQAYLAIKQGSQTWGEESYQDAAKFSATCTKDEITVSGPGGVSLVFKTGSRAVTALHDGVQVASYQDPYLWWITHTSVSTNGTNSSGGVDVAASLRVECELPQETKTPVPDTTPVQPQAALTDEPA